MLSARVLASALIPRLFSPFFYSALSRSVYRTSSFRPSAFRARFLVTSATMPYVESPLASPAPGKQVRKLVLCFDGTGNTFQGNTSDTNVVKIYDKLNRDDDYQYHYYQRKCSSCSDP